MNSKMLLKPVRSKVARTLSLMTTVAVFRNGDNTATGSISRSMAFL